MPAFYGAGLSRYVFFEVGQDSTGIHFVRVNKITGNVSYGTHFGTCEKTSEIKERGNGYGGKHKVEYKTHGIAFKCLSSEDLTLKDGGDVFTRTTENPL